MSYPNLVDNYAAATQAELRKMIVQSKQQKAVTKGSLESGPGARNESGALTGLEIPFKTGVPHGETALDAIGGTTSFEAYVAPQTDKMYVGLTQMGFTVEHEHFHNIDSNKGKIPESRAERREAMMLTYYQHQNWYNIGVKTGALAVVAAGGGGGSGTITFANDNTARGRSKGSLRLAVSWSTTAGKRVMYQSYTESTDTLTATFYITSKASTTTAVIVVTDGGTVVAGDVIVKYGHYKKVPYGLGYFINQASRWMQGINTATHTMFNARRVNALASLITPTMMDTAKGAKQIRANNVDAGKKDICHLTMGNYKTLAGFGYDLRQYNAEKGDANTTFALPTNFEDEQNIYVQDADFEDAYIYIRDRSSFFEYRQSPMQKISPGDAQQYVGTNSKGSTEFYENFGESYNLAWDARGSDGSKRNGAGGPNSAVVIDNLTIPDLSQMGEGISLV